MIQSQPTFVSLCKLIDISNVTALRFVLQMMILIGLGLYQAVTLVIAIHPAIMKVSYP